MIKINHHRLCSWAAKLKTQIDLFEMENSAIAISQGIINEIEEALESEEKEYQESKRAEIWL